MHQFMPDVWLSIFLEEISSSILLRKSIIILESSSINNIENTETSADDAMDAD